MTSDQIKSIQSRIGTVPDGIWGPKSIAACQRHLTALMPRPNPWPSTDRRALTSFYGAAGDESRLVNLPVAGFGILYDGQPVKTIRVNGECAESLLRVLRVLRSAHPDVLRHYAGCYNDRPMRGGSTPSLHARGAAIDLWPEKNGNHTHWPTAAEMPLGVMEAFAREGWIAAGAFWSRDAMHFKATR